jgi:hypothetical protein
MFQTEVEEKIKTHILYSITLFFFENRAVYEIMLKIIVERGRPQMTIWRMRIAYWITKAIYTLSEYVIRGQAQRGLETWQARRCHQYVRWRVQATRLSHVLCGPWRLLLGPECTSDLYRLLQCWLSCWGFGRCKVAFFRERVSLFPKPDSPHPTVNSIPHTLCGCSSLQDRQFCLPIYPERWKWAASGVMGQRWEDRLGTVFKNNSRTVSGILLPAFCKYFCFWHSDQLIKATICQLSHSYATPCICVLSVRRHTINTGRSYKTASSMSGTRHRCTVPVLGGRHNVHCSTT